MNAVATLFGSEETRSQVGRWRTELIEHCTLQQQQQSHPAAAEPESSASAASAAARNRRSTAAIIRQMAG